MSSNQKQRVVETANRCISRESIQLLIVGQTANGKSEQIITTQEISKHRKQRCDAILGNLFVRPVAIEVFSNFFPNLIRSTFNVLDPLAKR